jgi:hypothetical protein
VIVFPLAYDAKVLLEYPGWGHAMPYSRKKEHGFATNFGKPVS